MTQAWTTPNATDSPVVVEVDPLLPPMVAVLSVVLFTAVSMLCALIEVTLVPLRHGTTVVPVTVLLAIVSNIAVPTLSRRAVPLTVAALFPAVAWVLTVILLSQARPEGDLLLIGTAPLVDVTYALLGLGLASGLATVIRGQHAGLAQRRYPPPSAAAGGATANLGPALIAPVDSASPSRSVSPGQSASPGQQVSPSQPVSSGPSVQPKAQRKGRSRRR